MNATRISSFSEFWPYYLSEHRLPACRTVHFAGTSTFLSVVIWRLASAPGPVLATLVLGGLTTWAAFQMDAKRSSAPVLLGIIVLAALFDVRLLLGVVAAYAFAWVGHFLIEHNRPATFTYPLWSLAGDFKMYSWMLRGKLWTGTSPEVEAAEISSP